MTTPENTDLLAGTAIERLMPYLPAVSAAGPQPTGDPAAKSLYHAIAGRLRELGEADALADFVRQPQNNSLVRRLLATALRNDPAYAAELADVVAAVPSGGPTELPRAVAPTVATPAPSRRLSRRILLTGLAVLTVAVVLVCLVARNILGELDNSGGLTTQSSCADFRQAPKDDRMRALAAIALARDVPELDSPLALTAVTQACDAQPTTQLGDVVARFGD